jgi:hypothetical protein
MNTLKLISNHTKKLLPLAVSTLNPPNSLVLLRNIGGLLKGQSWVDFINLNKISYERLIRDTVEWLKHSQDVIGTGGVGCYEFYRWTKGYPEVTGYIIPTIWDCYHHFKEEDLKDRALRMTDWELRIQHPSGGWEGFYEGDGQPPVVFNTGQVLRGLMRTYKETNDEKYLIAACRAADWIVDTQDEDGSWTKTNFKQMKRVYDTYVTAPLSALYVITQNERYKTACIKNCDFVLLNQHKNGWFEKADNTLLNNEAPVLHTISYTIDGLIETGLNLSIDKYVAAGKLAADALLHKSEISDMMPARLDKDWKTRADYSCLTGDAQLGIIFMRLYAITNDKRYVNAALKLCDFLAYTQKVNNVGKNRKGGIAGSYPIWGMYCPLKYPSWAAKYYIDLLFMIKNATGLD